MTIAVEPSFVPDAVCQGLVDCFDRHIGVLGMPDSQSTFSSRVLRLRQLPAVVPEGDPSLRQMRAIRWLATQHLRDVFRDPHVYPEETQMVSWSVGHGQPLHLDLERPTTNYAAILYLNDGFLGGETFFEGGRQVRPRKGTLVAFPGTSLRHGVRTVLAGRRLTMPMWFTNLEGCAEP